jgi:hypothetical protein
MSTCTPTYKVNSNFEKNGNGDIVLSINVAQSGVDDKFRMLVPLYLELADGRIAPLGRVALSGNNFQAGKIPLKGIKETPRRAMVNYYDDVLASP